MKRFAVVTDSTSNLMPGLAEAHDVDVIPLNVHWGEASYLDGVTLEAETFYQWLRERKDFPKTSQPSAGAFIEFFQQVAEERGVDEILDLGPNHDIVPVPQQWHRRQVPQDLPLRGPEEGEALALVSAGA